VLVKNAIIGTTGVGEVTLINSNDIAKISFVAGLLLERAFVYAYRSISEDKLAWLRGVFLPLDNDVSSFY
jgi:hypothetical protein